MSLLRNVFLTLAAVAVMSLTAGAAAKPPAGHWAFFHFDGRDFVPGRGGEGLISVALRPGALPVLLGKVDLPEAVPLESGTGALAGICYRQRSGGKLHQGAPFVPAAGFPVQILSGGRTVATAQSDAQGFFLVTLPAGTYRVTGAGLEVSVENGRTTLVPLRVGKRMVD